MVIEEGIIKKVYVVAVFPDTSIENNNLPGTGWLMRVNQCNDGSTINPEKLEIDGLIYQNIVL